MILLHVYIEACEGLKIFFLGLHLPEALHIVHFKLS